MSNPLPLSDTTHSRPTEFEVASRFIRWLVIGVIIITFPKGFEQSNYVYVIAAIASLYNMLRYVPSMARLRWFASPATVIFIDNIFVCCLIALTGNISTPYSAFLFLMVTSSSYWYRFQGVLCTVGMQIVLLAVARQMQLFRPIEFSFVRNIYLIISALLILGLLVERLTRLDKQERDSFRRLAKESETESSLLMALVDSLTSAIFVTNKHGKIIQHNGAAEAMGKFSGSLKGQHINKVLPLYVRTDPDGKPIQIITGNLESQHRRDLRVKLDDNKSLDLDLTITPVQTQNSDTISYVIICEDITHELSLNEQQSEFISVASHELRTPIAIMEAALSALKHSRETIPEMAMKVIDQAHANTVLLSGIVKDLSIISEAKNDNIPVQLENIIPGKLAKQLAEDFETQIKHKGLSLRVIIADNLPTVLSTERHIREILQNYMTNAIKYSNEGTITLTVAPTKNGGVTFSVQDTGIGITPSAQKNLFVKFFRAEDPKIQQIGGTGLGLYLSKALANRLNGRVWCESKFGKGSTFYLEVPPFSGLRRDRQEVVRNEVANLVDGL